MMEYFNNQPEDQLSDLQKAKISEIVAETDFKMI